MKTNFKLTGLLSIFLVFSLSTYAAESAFEDVQYDSESQILAITPNPSSLWEEYLTKSDIIQGTNTKKGRAPFQERARF